MYVRALTATVLAATASQAQGQQLDAALRDTLTSDPQIAGAEAGIRAAEAEVDLNRSARLPTLSLDARGGFRRDDTLYGPRDTRTLGFGLSAGVPLYTGGELGGRVRAARAALEGATARRDLTVNMRLADTAALYAGLYRDTRIEAARADQVANVESLLTATRARQRGGAATQTDTYQAVARLAMAKGRLAEARATLIRSQEELRAVTGTERGASEDAEPPVLPAGTVADLPAQLDTFPAMKLAAAEVAVARAELRVARAERAPKVYLTSAVQTANDFAPRASLPAGFRTGLQWGVSLRLPLFQSGPAARVRQAEQQLVVRQEERRATERQLVEDIRARFAQLRTMDAALPVLVRALEASRAALTGVKTELTVGARTSLDVLNAQEEVTRVEIQIAGVRQQRLALAYAILGTMGRLQPAAAPAPAPAPARVAAVEAPRLHYDKTGLWVWQGSATWSLKAGRRVA